jgi:hypothetical protein
MSGGEPFQCPDCNMSYSERRRLVRHIKMHHTQVRPSSTFPIFKYQVKRMRNYLFRIQSPNFYIFKRSPRIDSKESIPPAFVARAGIFKNSMGARRRGGIGFSYRPARLHRLAEFIPWHQFRGPINI